MNTSATMQKKQRAGAHQQLLVYNTSSVDDKLKFNPKDRTEKLDVPVMYVFKEAAKKYFSDQTATLDIKLKVDIGEKKRTGRNVIGYIDNGAARTDSTRRPLRSSRLWRRW